MPRWVPLMFMGIGLVFIAVAVLVGVVGARYARAELGRLEGLPSLSAASLEDSTEGTEAVVEGAISPRNRAVFRNFVAYIGEELDFTTDRDGDREQTWRSARRETPPLLIEAGGVVALANDSYGVTGGHETWYDEATLGPGETLRDGSRRYHGLVAGGPVTVIGAVVAGPEGNELEAATLFAGTREEFLASQREGVAFLPAFGALFGGVGLVVAAVGAFLFPRAFGAPSSAQGEGVGG